MTGGPAKSRPRREANGSQADADADADGAAPPPKPSTVKVAWRRTCRDLIRLVTRIIDFGVRSFHVMMKIIGPCFVCLALGLTSFVTYTYFTALLPTLEADYGRSGQVGATVVGLFLLCNTIYNYGKSILSDPGLPPEFSEAKVTVDPDELDQPPPRQCKHCSRLKPPRAHHCSVCRRCVLKMDHHCPWINNCVGWGNYRHFCLFMLYLALSCLFVITTFFPLFYQALFYPRRLRYMDRGMKQCITTSFMIACSILIALSILGGFHVYLVLTNQSTIEFQLNLLKRKEARKNGEYFRNPYDMGRRRNFQSVFGPNAFCRFVWMMPYLAQPPSGDGLVFSSLSRLKV